MDERTHLQINSKEHLLVYILYIFDHRWNRKV